MFCGDGLNPLVFGKLLGYLIHVFVLKGSASSYDGDGVTVV